MRKEITPTRTKSLRLTLDEWRAVQEAADAAHMSTHGWIRAVVTVALGNSELPKQIERLLANKVINESQEENLPHAEVCAKCDNAFYVKNMKKAGLHYLCISCYNELYHE